MELNCYNELSKSFDLETKMLTRKKKYFALVIAHKLNDMVLLCKGLLILHKNYVVMNSMHWPSTPLLIPSIPSIRRRQLLNQFVEFPKFVAMMRWITWIQTTDVFVVVN